MDILVTEFGGLRNDRERKLVPDNYLYDATNVNYDSLSGFDKIKGVTEVYNDNANTIVNGIFDYVYEDSSNNSVSQTIGIVNGNIYKNILTNPAIIYSGLNNTAKCSFTVLNDKLFISNGEDFPLIYDGKIIHEMGSPLVKENTLPSLLVGQYYYAMTIVIGGVESYGGTVSNKITVNNKSIELEIPLGPEDVTERRIYRTTGNGNTLKLVATIANNIDLTYTDSEPDTNLGVNIITVNDLMPKPSFLQTSNSRLVGAVNKNNPTLLYTTETFKEFFTNIRGTVQVSGTSNDNTPLMGIEQDYNRIVAASKRQIYTIDMSNEIPVCVQSRANLGCLNGYSMKRIPDNQYTSLTGEPQSFPGGVMFVSTENDVRLFNGNFALPIATTLDNLKTENWSEFIQRNIGQAINNGIDVNSEYVDYKYHLTIDNSIYVFDIRGNKWSKYILKTENNENDISYIERIQEKLYIGIKNKGIIAELYEGTTILGEKFKANIQSPDLAASENLKYFKEIYFYFTNVTSTTPIPVTITIESDDDTPIVVDINMEGGFYDTQYYDSNYFMASNNDIDYRVVHINRYGRWLKWEINTEGFVNCRGFRLVAEVITNKEA